MKWSSITRLLGVCKLGSLMMGGCKDAPKNAVCQPLPPCQPRVVITSITPMPREQQPAPKIVPATPGRPSPYLTLPPIPPEPAKPVPSPTVAATIFPRGESPPPRRSFVDLTARPSFAHAQDYSWLSGEVEYSLVSKTWRLRYASVDEDDPHGGSVTLAEDPRLGALKDGQCVRVYGRLSNSEAKAIAPLYRIESLTSLEKREQQSVSFPDF